MSLPIIFAAKLRKVDIYLIEPNQVLGRANKFFLKSCKKIFCYTSKLQNYPENLKQKMTIIKPLVRKQIYDLVLSNKSKNKFTIMIVGGSQGAEIFDKNLKDIILTISKLNPIKVIHQTGEQNIENLKSFYSKNRIENIIFSFNKNFDELIQQSDFCITRAGASTIAELSLLSIPFVAVPLPSSKDNHQYENAKFYQEHGCCWIIDQKDFEKIEQFLRDIFNDKSDYLEKIKNLKKLNYQNSWINVNQKILREINEN